MNRSLLKAYYCLPGPLRSAAASLHGCRLQSWRYGPETERLVREALERETWGADRWEEWKAERLRFVLCRAASRVPHYRRLWEKRPGGAADEVSKWPVLEKESLRLAPLDFLADDCDRRRMYHEHTSGTSGKPVNLWLSREVVRAWYALAEARWRRWYGVSRRDRWAILGGQLVTRVTSRRPPFWVWNAVSNQLYMSSYHLAPDLISDYLKALRDYRVRYLVGYTSALNALAQEVLWQALDNVPLSVVITNAEPVLDHQRAAISAAFQCPVRETYGMSEAVAAASECEAGTLHMWPEVGDIEVLEGNRRLPAGQTGDLVTTGLLNADMPLIRYRVGDRIALAEENGLCPCGRTLPVLRSVEGRADDVLVTADGRKVGRLDPIFKGDLPVREAQIIQEAPDRLRVRYVPAPEFSEESANSLTERLRDRMGPVLVVLEQVVSIERGPNGKFRAVVSLLGGATSAAARRQPGADCTDLNM
jgi:phenylacetate-CoA ligase